MSKQRPVNVDDVLRTEVPWPTFLSAGIITKDQLEMIYQIDKQRTDTKLGLFHEKGTAHVELMKELLVGVNKDEYLQYVLAMLDELLAADSTVAKHFLALLVESKGYNDPYGPLMKLLTRSSFFILGKASTLLAKLLTYPVPASADAHAQTVLSRHLATFAEWIMFLLKSIDPKDTSESPKTQFAVAALQHLVATPTGRACCLENEGLPVLYGIISGAAGSNSNSIQMLYQTLFSLWSLSYSPEASMQIVSSKFPIIQKLVDILKTVQKEKVIRVALATLRNLLGTGSASTDMVSAGVMPVLLGLQPRKWADEDILEDIDLLIGALEVNLRNLSSWDVYKKEIMSGKLEWSPVHKSESFWKDNVKAFETNGFDTIKQLVALLESQEPQVLAIACSDIAEFIKVHPEGRKVMTQFGAKPLAMQVLKHPDPLVQKHALTCVQRLMVINWEYLSKA
jgi:V-type H+-transporting ATPase subunit H